MHTARAQHVAKEPEKQIWNGNPSCTNMSRSMYTLPIMKEVGAEIWHDWVRLSLQRAKLPIEFCIRVGYALGRKNKNRPSQEIQSNDNNDLPGADARKRQAEMAIYSLYHGTYAVPIIIVQSISFLHTHHQKCILR